MLDCPDDTVHERLELRRLETQESCTFTSDASLKNVACEHTGEAIQIYCAQELEEPATVFWIIREVLADHVQGRLKDGVKNRLNLRSKHGLQWQRQTTAEQHDNVSYPKSVVPNDSRHEVENLGITSCGNVGIVVSKDCVQERWHKVRINGL